MSAVSSLMIGAERPFGLSLHSCEPYRRPAWSKTGASPLQSPPMPSRCRRTGERLPLRGGALSAECTRGTQVPPHARPLVPRRSGRARRTIDPARRLADRLRRSQARRRSRSSTASITTSSTRSKASRTRPRELLAIWIWNQLAPKVPQLHRITIEETCSRCHYYGVRDELGRCRNRFSSSRRHPLRFNCLVW